MTIRQFASQWKQPYESTVFQQNFLLLLNTLILLLIIKLFGWFTKNVDDNQTLKAADKVLHINNLTIPFTAIWFVIIRPLSFVQEAQWNGFTKLMSRFVYPWLDKLLPPLYINPNIISLTNNQIKNVTTMHRNQAETLEEQYFSVHKNQRNRIK